MTNSSLLSALSRPATSHIAPLPDWNSSSRQAAAAKVRALSLDPHKMPRHVAIIMDGNRRWAKNQGWNAVRGHSIGAKTTRDIIQEASDLGIEALTLYTFSTENWKRSRAEIAALMRIITHNLRDELPLLMRNNVRFRHVGRRENLPEHLLKQIDVSEQETAENTGMTLCLAINYGGRAELKDAFQILAQRVQSGELQPQDIDENLIEATLYTQSLPEPDLLIRTGGDWRVSNFLPWQIAYAELWMTPVLWPDFAASYLHQAIAEFQTRERRFGADKQ